MKQERKIYDPAFKIKVVELRAFKENGYKFYHGVINSKNSVPLKMME